MKKVVKLRRKWKINPRTRIKPSAKIYSRQKIKKEIKKIEKELINIAKSLHKNHE